MDIQHIKRAWKIGNSISEPNKPIPNSFKIVDQLGHFFSPGDFFYYIFNFETLEFDYISDSVRNVLGVEAQDMSLEKLLSAYHPDDKEKILEKEKAVIKFKFNYLDKSELDDYKTVYMIRYLFPDGRIKKVLHQAKAINVTKDGKIQQVLGVHTDVTYLNIPIDHKVSFISDKYPSYYSLDPSNLVFDKVDSKRKYTNQELKILQLISQGKSNIEISTELFITINTIKTHRKNILNKSKSKNTTHLIANCIREGLI